MAGQRRYPCHQHPTRKTARRCYRCKKPICSECTRLLSRHFFCSSRCHKAFLEESRPATTGHKASPLRFRGISREIWQAFVILLLCLNTLLSWLAFRQTTHLATVLEQLKAAPVDEQTSLSPAAENRGEGANPPPSNRPRSTPSPIPQIVNRNEQASRKRGLSLEVVQGPVNVRALALTFDGGSFDQGAQEILDILKNEQVRCTFFLTGVFMKRFPAIVKRLVSEGHEVGNHTQNHPRLTSFAQNRQQRTLPGVDRIFVQQELTQASATFSQITGRPLAPLWRAPYGERNTEILRWAGELGYQHIAWTIDTLDWVADPKDPLFHSSQAIENRLFEKLDQRKNRGNGSIILMHLGTARTRDHLYERLPFIIHRLRTQGYQLVPISELVAPMASAGPLAE